MRPKWMKSIDTAYGMRDTHATILWLDRVVTEIKSPFNDGFSALELKRELFEFKCLLDDVYETLPDFGEDEVEWEKQRLYNKLKKRNDK